MKESNRINLIECIDQPDAGRTSQPRPASERASREAEPPAAAAAAAAAENIESTGIPVMLI